MPLEIGTFISDLVTTNPAAADAVSQGDDHLRLIKSTLKSTFPNITGAVTPTHTTLNFVDATSSIQTQLNAKAPTASPTFTGTATVPTLNVTTAEIIGSGDGTVGPIAGTLRGASGTGTNITGAPLILQGGNGTGSGGGGHIAFLTAPAGTSGTGANNLTEEMRITRNGGIAFGGAANFGSAGQVLVSNGDASPTWKAAPSSGPAFSAFNTATQSVSNNVVTKVVLNSEISDTNNAFDSTTNYRFQPTVAGYYFVTGTVNFTAGVLATAMGTLIYKNGAGISLEVYSNFGGTTNRAGASVSGVVFLNGSTDYLELFCFQNSGATQTTVANICSFSGCLLRT
jgi:hypothetical protein